MVVATMTNKRDGYETLLIDKADVDKLKEELAITNADLEEARKEVIGLNVQVVLLQSDLNCMEERIKVFENNIFCRTILWLDVRIKRLASYLRKRFNEWVERKWGSEDEHTD